MCSTELTVLHQVRVLGRGQGNLTCVGTDHFGEEGRRGVRLVQGGTGGTGSVVKSFLYSEKVVEKNS